MTLYRNEQPFNMNDYDSSKYNGSNASPNLITKTSINFINMNQCHNIQHIKYIGGDLWCNTMQLHSLKGCAFYIRGEIWNPINDNDNDSVCIPVSIYAIREIYHINNF
jgi:hypothetical protein